MFDRGLKPGGIFHYYQRLEGFRPQSIGFKSDNSPAGNGPVQISIAILLFGLFFGLLILEVPVALSLALPALSAIVLFNLEDPILIAQQIFSAFDSYNLLAIPLFLFAGHLLGECALSRRLLDFVLITLGRARGGVAVVTVVDLQDQWVVLNVREDQLARFAPGQTFDATLPALTDGDKNARHARFKVFYNAVLPDFATWRATRGGAGFDVRTFEVRARPTEPIAGARPGMSVLVQ